MMTWKAGYLWLLSALFCVTLTNAWAGKIYKWVDENGVTQFSTYPPLVQKKDQSVTTVKGLGTAGSRSTLSSADIFGVWFVIKNRKKHTLTIHKNGFNQQQQLSKTSWRQIASGEWVLGDGVLNLKYTQHNDKHMKGKTEAYYIKKPDDYSLTLFSKEGRKRLNYRKDTDELKSDKAISRLAQGMLGFWQGVGGGDSINFSNETFEITGKRKYKNSIRSYESTGAKYQGRWHLDDPYIDLEITFDDVHVIEETRSKVGQKWRWLIVQRTANALTVRDLHSRRVRKFIKIAR